MSRFGRAQMTGQRGSLAVLARCLQWELDEAAFELGAGRYSHAQQVVLADRLTQFADALRAGDQPVIVDTAIEASGGAQ